MQVLLSLLIFCGAGAFFGNFERNSPLNLKLPIQVFKDDVSQQRRDDSTLRSSLGRRFEDTVVHYPGPDFFIK